MKKTKFLALFKNMNFIKIWLSQLISLVCANMLIFILIGKIHKITDSTIAVTLLWGFYIFPSVLLGPFAGFLLDLLDKKKILIFSSLLQSFIVLFFLLTREKIWPIYSIALLYSFCDEFFNPAIGVLLPSIVKKRELPIANSIFLFTSQGSLAVGYFAGGMVLKFMGFSFFPFILISILLLIDVLLVCFLSLNFIHSQKITINTLSELWQEFIKGYDFIKNERKILFSIILLLCLQVLLGIGIVLVPSISEDILLIDFADSSYVIIFPVIVGATVGSFWMNKLISKYLKRYLIVSGLFLMGIALIILGMILPSIKHPAIFGSLDAFLIGFAFVLMIIPLQVLIQENTPFNIRGRVIGVLSSLMAIVAILPVFATATVIDMVGVKLVLIIIGMGLLSVGIYASKGKYGILSNYHRS